MRHVLPLVAALLLAPVSVGAQGLVGSGPGSSSGSVGATAANQTATQSAPGTSASTADTIQGNASGVPVPTAPSPGTFTNRSGTITTGGTSQTLAAINTARKALLVQNPCAATENLYINFTSAAAVGTSFELLPCGSYTSSGNFISTELVTVLAATTGHAFVAKEGQ